MREQFRKAARGYGDFKKQLFEKLWEYFSPMRKRREEIAATNNTSTMSSHAAPNVQT